MTEYLRALNITGNEKWMEPLEGEEDKGQGGGGYEVSKVWKQ